MINMCHIFFFSPSPKTEWQQKKHRRISSSVLFYSTEYLILAYHICGAKSANLFRSSSNFSDGHGVEPPDAEVL